MLPLCFVIRSVATWAGVDNAVSSPVNVNLAAYKNAMSTIDAFGAVDGSHDEDWGTTSSKQLGGDNLVVTIDLKRKTAVAEVHIFQHSSVNHKLMQMEIMLSDDGTTFKSVGKARLDLGHPGDLAAVLFCPGGSAGRYIRIVAGDKSLYYWGLGEVEVYAKARPDPATMLATSQGGKAPVSLTFFGDSGHTVRIARKTMDNAGALSNFPSTPEDGVKVYEGASRSPLVRVGSGYCRTRSIADSGGFKSNIQNADFKQCKAACDKDKLCTGIETAKEGAGNYNCELWHDTPLFIKPMPVSTNAECWRRQRTVVDKTAKMTERYFYTAFVFSKTSGWSPIDWVSTLSIQPGEANPNFARDKPVASNVDFEASNAPYRVTDGVATSGVRDLKKSGNVFRLGIFLDFVRRSGTTRAPHVGPQHVRGAK